MLFKLQGSGLLFTSSTDTQSPPQESGEPGEFVILLFYVLRIDSNTETHRYAESLQHLISGRRAEGLRGRRLLGWEGRGGGT